MAKIITSKDNDMLDQIAHQYYGDRLALAAIYEANPGLADHDLVLPAGIEIILPDWEKPAPIVPTWGLSS
jgi:phage tail protein X